jgi:hypothetical protein
MNFLDNDINMAYHGGSGGFLLLHLILLEGKHDADFPWYPYHVKKFVTYYPEYYQQLRIPEDFYKSVAEPGFPDYHEYYTNFNDVSAVIRNKLIKHHIQNPSNLDDFPAWRDFLLNEIVQSQWNISSPEEWKWSEYWPKNDVNFVTRPGKRRIFNTCNMYDEWMRYNGTKLFIYTDIHTQVRMALRKRANWFFRPVAGDTTLRFSFIKTLLRNNSTANGMTVFSAVPHFVNTADKSVVLQELVLDPTSVGLSNNDKQQELIDRWITLHKKFDLYDKVMRGHV